MIRVAEIRTPNTTPRISGRLLDRGGSERTSVAICWTKGEAYYWDVGSMSNVYIPMSNDSCIAIVSNHLSSVGGNVNAYSVTSELPGRSCLCFISHAYHGNK